MKLQPLCNPHQRRRAFIEPGHFEPSGPRKCQNSLGIYVRTDTYTYVVAVVYASPYKRLVSVTKIPRKLHEIKALFPSSHSETTKILRYNTVIILLRRVAKFYRIGRLRLCNLHPIILYKSVIQILNLLKRLWRRLNSSIKAKPENIYGRFNAVAFKTDVRKNNIVLYVCVRPQIS